MQSLFVGGPNYSVNFARYCTLFRIRFDTHPLREIQWLSSTCHTGRETAALPTTIVYTHGAVMQTSHNYLAFTSNSFDLFGTVSLADCGAPSVTSRDHSKRADLIHCTLSPPL